MQCNTNTMMIKRCPNKHSSKACCIVNLSCLGAVNGHLEIIYFIKSLNISYQKDAYHDLKKDCDLYELSIRGM